ncbi:MAG TPA: hypothetical protein VK930_10880 [Verrucomicrobiae bacterium]|jgi:hypothetical protein|nr:hypothetical protein [Verrucomicrobiae bacterium]
MEIGSRTSPADLRPALVAWIVPSVGDLIFAALLGLLAYTTLSVRLLGDAGIGWHIRTGQIILATHAIPRVDPFSATMSGRVWFAWEWLYDALVGWLDRAAGLNGVVLFTALVIAAVFAWTFRLLLRRGTNILLALLLVLLAASAAMIHFLARPHVVSWLFTVAWFWILDSSETGCASDSKSFATSESNRRRGWMLWLLPPLMLVWVNVHGGFLLGFALLAIYWCSAAWQWLRPTGDRFDDILRKIRAGQLLRVLTLTGILSGLATLVNPYGFQLHVHIYRYLTNRFLIDHINEFQSPNFHYVAQKCFAGLLLLTLVALAAKKREAGRVRVSQALIILFAVYSGLYASRNIPVSSLLLILVIAPWLSEAMDRFSFRRMGERGFASPQFLQRMEAVEFSLRGHLWPIAMVLLTCWIAAHGGKLGAKPLMDAHFDATRFPAAAVDYLAKEDVQGPLVSPDDWGGYLIYRLYPRVRMVIDDRHDFYGEQFLKSYLKMVNAEPGWQDFLQQSRAHCVVVPKDSALANLLEETAGWKAIYSDEVATVFVRSARGTD